MTRHVSTENLARFSGGDLRGHQARRVEAHLRGCARCRETSARLDEVPVLLAATQVPEMPAHLAVRIETALATESAHRAAGVPSPLADGTPADRPGHSSDSGRGSRRKRRRGMATPALRLLAAAGAIVIVAGGGFELLTHLGESTGSSTSSSGGSGQQSASAGSGGARRDAAAAESPLHYQLNGQLTTIRPVRTATNYRQASLGREAARVLTRPKPEPGPVTGGTMNPDHGLGTTQLGTLSGCLNNIADGHRVLLVDIASFNGAPATLIVTAGPGAAREAWIVSPRCSASVRHVLARQPLPGNG
jgi:hypothetical protein